MLTVGLPRALVHYYYYPFWKTFFEEIGMKVVVSNPTTKEIVTKGVKVSVAEICVPIKIFAGHVVELLEMGVDYVFVPRFISIEKGKFFCPKFMALPEIVMNTISGLKEKILSVNIQVKSENLLDRSIYKDLSRKLGISRGTISRAASKAWSTWSEFRRLCKKGYAIDEATDILFGKQTESSILLPDHPDLILGIIGYVYNIYDEFISMGILKKLRAMNVKVVTFEMLDEKELVRGAKGLSRMLFWTFSNKLLGSAGSFYDHAGIDGLIHVTAFGCGPDSMVGKYIELEIERDNKPFMTLRVDEHTGESHLLTRIEAFVDMIRRKRTSKRGEGII